VTNYLSVVYVNRFDYRIFHIHVYLAIIMAFLLGASSDVYVFEYDIRNIDPPKSCTSMDLCKRITDPENSTSIALCRRIIDPERLYSFILSISAAGSNIFGQTTTKAQIAGLGGVDPKTSTVTSG